MNTRFIVHKAYRGNVFLGSLVEVAGRYIMLWVNPQQVVAAMLNQKATHWIATSFVTVPSFSFWHEIAKRRGATRFERVTMLGMARNG